jgi:hypothetical protein
MRKQGTSSGLNSNASHRLPFQIAPFGLVVERDEDTDAQHDETTAPNASARTPDREDRDFLPQRALLDRQRRRVRRLRAKVRPGGDAAELARWSQAVSECANLCERIGKEPAHGLTGLAVKYRALLWLLIEDDVILDRAVRRRLLEFGSELDALAKQMTSSQCPSSSPERGTLKHASTDGNGCPAARYP